MPTSRPSPAHTLMLALTSLLAVVLVAFPVLAAPRPHPEGPANQAASITYDIFALAPARTPYNAFVCDANGAVFYGAETKGVAPGYLGRMTPDGQVTEWAYGWGPISMIKDNKDRIWTADFESTEIARLAPAANRLTTWDTGYSRLHGISYQDGIVWTTSRDGYVLRFKPGSGELRVFAMPNNTPLKHSLMDRQGRLWIAAGDQPGLGAAVYMFDSATRRFTRYPLPAGFNPWAIHEAADGAIWFSNFSMKGKVTSDQAISRLDPATAQWTSFGGYPHPNRSTSLDRWGDKLIGVNILGDEFFLFDPASAGETIALAPTIIQGVVQEVKTLTPSSRILTPIRTTLSPATGSAAGAAAAPFIAYPIPNPFQIHSLFGVRVCDNHVWMSGLLADQLYHFTSAATATPTPAQTASPTPTQTPTPAQTATATPTPTPTPIRAITLELTPVADAYMNLWNPDTNYGNSPMLAVRPSYVAAALRFDLSALPAGATINRAELALYTLGRSNDQPLTAVAYRMLRAWDENQITANVARTGQPWSAPLANGAGDHDAAALAAVSLPATGWATLDITAAARAWVGAGPQENFGLLLQATSTGLVQYGIASREGWPAGQQPKLTIHYSP